MLKDMAEAATEAYAPPAEVAARIDPYNDHPEATQGWLQGDVLRPAEGVGPALEAPAGVIE